MYLTIERIALALFAGAVTLIAFTMAFAAPPNLTPEDILDVRAAYEDGLIYTDTDCHFTAEQIARTEVSLALLPADVCKSRSQELVYLSKSKSLVACLSEKAEWAMRVVIGTNGLGKTREGNRKSPLGTYWLGQPRHSSQFGIFIPVGYPNAANLAQGFTGSAIGVHGPIRGLHCHPQLSLAKNWTAGCIAVGRDSQIITVSEWILDNWPAKITITR